MPSLTLIVDTNIVLAAVIGVKTRNALSIVGITRQLVSSSVAASEALALAARLRDKFPKAERDAADLLGVMDIRPASHYVDRLPEAEATLRNAVASRNGSVRDAHILALAWLIDADIWSHDRDFAGTGWRSWSSANLVARLSGETMTDTLEA